MSHRHEVWIRLASILAAREPVHARSVATLLTTTTVIDAAGNDAITITLAAKQEVGRCIAGLCLAIKSQNGCFKQEAVGDGSIPVTRSLGLAAAKPIMVTVTETMAKKRMLIIEL